MSPSSYVAASVLFSIENNKSLFWPSFTSSLGCNLIHVRRLEVEEASNDLNYSAYCCCIILS